MFLIKFVATEERARQVQRGQLYMNSLSWFWKNGNVGQRDVLEGVVGIKGKDVLAFPEDLRQGIKHDIQFQAVGYKYCNVLCASVININKIGETGHFSIRAPQNMTNFGEYAVVITDVQAFTSRVVEACKRMGYRVLCGKVNYHPPLLNGLPNDGKTHMILKSMGFLNLSNAFSKAEITYDSFDKSTAFENENEWRVSIYRGEKTKEPLILNIGDIQDITFVKRRAEIDSREAIEQLAAAVGYPQDGDSTYSGNISRRGMRELFYELGDNQVEFLFDL